MIMNKEKKFIIAISIQVLIIFLVPIFGLIMITRGTEVVLEINPTDTKFLQDNRLELSYDISKFYDSDSLRVGDEVYVSLYRGIDSWRPQYFKTSKPSSGEVFIKGTVSKILGDYAYVNYGIENYLIPEELRGELDILKKRNYARVIIDKDGNATIKNIIMGEERFFYPNPVFPDPVSTFDEYDF